MAAAGVSSTCVVSVLQPGSQVSDGCAQCMLWLIINDALLSQCLRNACSRITTTDHALHNPMHAAVDEILRFTHVTTQAATTVDAVNI
jgi:hypothetical protein